MPHDKHRVGLYRNALEKARRDLAFAIAERDQWNLKIVKAQNAVRSMAAMLANAETTDEYERGLQKQVNIGQAIEALVNGAAEPIGHVEVRQGLNLYGYGIEGYANPTSLIQQTLQRLAEAGRIRDVGDGRYTRTAFYQALLDAK